MWKRLRKWWQAEGDLVRLKGLDDRLLADIGLEREDLRVHVLGWKKGPGWKEGLGWKEGPGPKDDAAKGAVSATTTTQACQC